MDPGFVTCSFCGFEFDPSDTFCAHGCPLGAACHLVRCPSCGYEFPARPRRKSLMSRLLRKDDVEPSWHPTEVVRATQLRAGEVAEVTCVGGGKRGREDRLAVFGLVPGAEILVLQQRPSCVVRIDQTELALDREIGAEILVRRRPNGRQDKPGVEAE